MFAWGRPLELARRFAVYSGMALLLIAFVAGAIVWARRSQGVRPYFIYAADGDEWSVYSENLRDFDAEVPWTHLFQESLVDRYARDYFRVPDNMADAENLWCKCQSCEAWNKCRVCCAGASAAYDFFARMVLPAWRNKFGRGERTELANARAAPMGVADERGGYWKITGDLTSNKSAAKKIVGFAKVERARTGYPGTLGFYVAEFYFYGDE